VLIADGGESTTSSNRSAAGSGVSSTNLFSSLVVAAGAARVNARISTKSSKPASVEASSSVSPRMNQLASCPPANRGELK